MLNLLVGVTSFLPLAEFLIYGSSVSRLYTEVVEEDFHGDLDANDPVPHFSDGVLLSGKEVFSTVHQESDHQEINGDSKPIEILGRARSIKFLEVEAKNEVSNIDEELEEEVNLEENDSCWKVFIKLISTLVYPKLCPVIKHG